MTGFFFAPRIGWGTGAIEQLSGLGARAVLVVVDPAVAARRGERRIVEELAKSEATVEVRVDPQTPDTLAAVRDLADQLRRSSTDLVVAVGGGRTLDGAKAARFQAESPAIDLTSISPLLELPDPARRRLVALPTTSGSGAEATWTADLTEADGTPVEAAHRGLLPHWALVDPALAEGLPPDRIVDGGFASLAGAAEAYLSAWSNPLSDALAVAAIATVLERLPHALRWSEDPDARGALHYAATEAGLAASNAQRGLAHALARALGPTTGLPYARLLGIALPFVLDFDRTGARERLERLAERVRPAGESPALPLADRVRRLADHLRFPATVRAAGGSADAALADLDGAVRRARRSPGVLSNPRVPTDDELRALAREVVG